MTEQALAAPEMAKVRAQIDGLRGEHEFALFAGDASVLQVLYAVTAGSHPACIIDWEAGARDAVAASATERSYQRQIDRHRRRRSRPCATPSARRKPRVLSTG